MITLTNSYFVQNICWQWMKKMCKMLLWLTFDIGNFCYVASDHIIGVKELSSSWLGFFNKIAKQTNKQTNKQKQYKNRHQAQIQINQHTSKNNFFARRHELCRQDGHVIKMDALNFWVAQTVNLA